MKKTLSLILALLMVVCVFAACGGNNSSSATPNPTEETKKTFTVGFDAGFPPYGYLKDGEYVGYDLDLAAEVAKRNNWELVLKAIEWDSKDMELDTGAIDCIWNGFTIQGREDKYTWTEPYADNSQVIVVKKDSGITTYADLAGKKVTVQADSSALSAINSEERADFKASLGELIVCADYLAGFMDLEAGAVDAVAMDIGVAQFQIEGKEDTYMILDEILLKEQYGVGFKLGNTELRDQVQKTMKEMVKDGTFKTISEKWFDGEDTCVLSAE